MTEMRLCLLCPGKMLRRPFLVHLPMSLERYGDEISPYAPGKVVYWWTCEECGARETCDKRRKR